MWLSVCLRSPLSAQPKLAEAIQKDPVSKTWHPTQGKSGLSFNVTDALTTGDRTQTHTEGDPGTRHHLQSKEPALEKKKIALLTLDLDFQEITLCSLSYSVL